MNLSTRIFCFILFQLFGQNVSKLMKIPLTYRVQIWFVIGRLERYPLHAFHEQQQEKSTLVCTGNLFEVFIVEGN